MAKSVVVVSGYVDAMIKEYQRDVTFYIFKTLEELDQFIETTPIRAETLFFSRDVIPLTNTSLNYLVNIMGKVFFNVDNIVYITEQGSPEIDSVKFLVKTKDYSNWEIVQGALTREYVTSVINGTARSDFSNVKRKAVYRVPKDAYIRSKTRHSDLLENERYLDDDERIQEMENEELPIYIPPEKESTCVAYDIVGEDCLERTVFSFVLAQYLSTHGKTLILERDCEYHTLGEIVTKSGVQCDIIHVDLLIKEPDRVMEMIRNTPSKLIAVLCERRVRYDYNFVFSLLYNNLISNVMYMIREDVFGEEPTESKYTVVFPNTMCGVLSMCEKVNMNFLHKTKFVAISIGTFNELRLPTKESVTSVIEDVLNIHDLEQPVILSITSTVMGQSSNYDLRSTLWVD